MHATQGCREKLDPPIKNAPTMQSHICTVCGMVHNVWGIVDHKKGVVCMYCAINLLHVLVYAYTQLAEITKVPKIQIHIYFDF